MQLCQNFGISGGGGVLKPQPLPPRYATVSVLYFETWNRYLLIGKQPPNTTTVHLFVKSVEHISISEYLMDFTLIIKATEVFIPTIFLKQN
jgi:hypothetical protein